MFSNLDFGGFRNLQSLLKGFPGDFYPVPDELCAFPANFLLSRETWYPSRKTCKASREDLDLSRET